MKITYAAVIVLCLAGCGTKREETQHREEQSKRVQVEQTKTERNAYAPDGTPYVETTYTVRTLDETTRAEADTSIQARTTIQAPEIGAAARVVAGVATGGGSTWAPILTTLATTALAAFAAHQTAKAKSETKRADEHKADAIEGWAKALPPSADK